MRYLKILTVILISCLSFSLIGCGSEVEETASKDNTAVQQNNDKDENTHFRQQLEDNEILYVEYQTKAGEFAAGTAFALQTDYCDEPILITAHHIFGPDGGLDRQLDGKEIASFVTGGNILDMFTEEPTGATIKETIVIPDSDSVPNVSKDIAAFKMDNWQNLKTFKLAEAKCKKGDRIYLLSYLWDNEKINDNNIYPGTCEGYSDGEICYSLDGNFSTSGASGGPIVNENGEVVGIHIASNRTGMYFGNSSDSFNKMLKNSIK